MYIRQVDNNRLGNFINLTPAIKLLSSHFDQLIKVHFETDYVRECFLDCPFIKIIDYNPKQPALFNSGYSDKSNTQRDHMYVMDAIRDRYNINGTAHTYVDQPEFSGDTSGKVAVMLGGSGNESPYYLETKIIPDEVMNHIKGRLTAEGYHVVMTGSANDLKRSKWAFNLDLVINDIRQSLGVINKADIVIGNDTGLMHAAGAMDKTGFVLWKNTRRPRCENAGTKMTYSTNWINDFNEWIDSTI